EGLAGLLTTVSTAGCALVVGRLALALAATAVAAALPGGGRGRSGGARIALALSPRALRPAVVLLLTAGVAAGSAGSAAAAPPTATSASVALAAPTTSATGLAPAGSLPDPLWKSLPEPGWSPAPPPPRPLLPPGDPALVTSGATRPSTGAARAALTVDDRVVVRRGDSLWRIAARHLGADASDAEVAAEWPRWWHANRRVIGTDPDLLLPGMRLMPPDGADFAPYRPHSDRPHPHRPHTDQNQPDTPEENR
ncbi:MAG TPA: LysM domain-containing protein, partial [Actinomycetales bacterium]|nr:LysM domain-containing protein [Actinomycetales bacterium]